jgi:CheY-like chemotaxis protein
MFFLSQITRYLMNIFADHKTNIMVLRAMLKKHGYSCESAENGLEAVKVAATRKYDLILMVRFCLQ